MDASTTERVEALASDPRLTWSLIAAGIALRLVHFLHGTSLSVDESLLTLNVLDRSYAGLLEPLDGNQGAPVGFLMLLKWVTDVLGNSEYALRLVALVSGIASLLLFRSLAARYLAPIGATIALALFAVAGNLIFYSAQVKQYSGDVMFVVILYLIADHVRTQRPAWWRMPLYGLIGAAAIGFSHPAVFVLAGLAISQLWFTMIRGERRRFDTIIAFAIWGIAFAALYWLSLRKLSSQEWLLNWWDDEFMPLPPTSMDDVRWMVTAFFQMFTKMLGFSLQGIGALTVLVGVLSMFSSDRQRLANLVLPILIALGASGLQLYPFCCRLILFTAPALLLLMARGAVSVLSATRAKPSIGVLLLGLMFLHPVMWAGYHVIRPRYEEELKPELTYLQEQAQAGDVIYLYYGAKPAFTYYARRFGWDLDECCIVGERSRKDWDGYERDLRRLEGQRRVWIVFTHIYDWKSVDERVLFLHYLDNLGVRLDGFETTGAAIYLYDLGPPADRPPRSDPGAARPLGPSAHRGRAAGFPTARGRERRLRVHSSMHSRFRTCVDTAAGAGRTRPAEGGITLGNPSSRRVAWRR